jgi:DNA gyrase subunit A
VVRQDMVELKEKYGEERRTQIMEAAVGEVRFEDLIAEEINAVTISHHGYIKRLPLNTYRAQHRGGRGVTGAQTHEDDFIEHFFVASTHAYLLFFTNRGQVYWVKVYDLPQMSRQAAGRAIANVLSLKPEEKITSVIPVRRFDPSRCLLMATRRGLVKKTVLEAYSRPRAGGLIAISLEEGDSLIDTVLTQPGDEVVLSSKMGMAIRFDESDARPMGRDTRGVKGINLLEGDEVVGMVVADPQGYLLTVCENGYGKRTAIEEYRKTRRGGKGVINIKTTERNGRVVAIKAVVDEDELMLITANGMMLRTDLTQLREIGRATQGVRLIRLDDGDRVVAVAKIAREENGEADAAGGEPSGGEAGEIPPGPAVDPAAGP